MGRTVVLGITGGIAAYKGAEICRLLVKSGYKVRVIMTRAATSFVNPLTFETLSGGPVGMEMFKRPEGWEIQHISWAQEASCLLVAPATANIIGKTACGIADDLLSTTIMATPAPVVFAPAMNVEMYNNKIVQENMIRLKKLGFWFIEPDSGFLACGDQGRGRLAEPQAIVDFLLQVLEKKRDFAGQVFMITAGPTREPLDPIRYIGNYSSGKMGFALAEAARDRGAEVVLVSGPTELKPPQGIQFFPIRTSLEMREVVLKQFPMSDIVIKAAAVADYRPEEVSEQKIKKTQGNLVLKLKKNPDILGELGKLKKEQLLIGFAAETEELRDNALKKLKNKNLDMIVANDITLPGAGFEVDTNQVKVFKRSGEVIEFPLMTKGDLADKILDEIKKIRP
ncbi:bifunctional phosphopantothenoylcysteine decarboxylase/phosphopantothenate--cysteine ligase CoaBC [Candidatus Contubernalis alkaliaceticus]|uniref:bifunctional phosphopantothenoylcysteine decarboxylase/phosphopantothenate--cysteine ligase CoaBC n=1 Tax=Candidatus Contubernalis alkaliaceticus TaxID=338645 RepID=UPI001F4BD66D|nr:bifunctional phosphopantothenoylcysteine decarboxylase/phosphopantothenate--cysteine ligase CoaBC [Candidatus Contubernalis alkalaceticus]UNC92789.1 bifunctional phosphopantothenoylcysteine decarboxylase/phosphopantothenate--cysteine ligase CoaBC [Candidatus Contubernalis alkalaceticus]